MASVAISARFATGMLTANNILERFVAQQERDRKQNPERANSVSLETLRTFANQCYDAFVDHRMACQVDADFEALRDALNEQIGLDKNGYLLAVQPLPSKDVLDTWNRMCLQHGTMSDSELVAFVESDKRNSLLERFCAVLMYEGNRCKQCDAELLFELAQSETYMQAEIADFLSGI